MIERSNGEYEMAKFDCMSRYQCTIVSSVLGTSGGVLMCSILTSHVYACTSAFIVLAVESPLRLVYITAVFHWLKEFRKISLGSVERQNIF